MVWPVYSRHNYFFYGPRIQNSKGEHEMKEKRVTRTLNITINTSKDILRIVAPLDKRQYVVLMYLLRGMKTRIQRFKEIKQTELESKDTYWEKSMRKGEKLN